MRIGVDARELSGHPTGVGRYLAGLLRQWREGDAARRHQFVLYTTAGDGLPPDAFERRVIDGQGGTAWEQRALPAALARDRLDVFFSPGYTAPLFTRIPTVVAVHDVSFAAHPEWFSLREGWRRRTITKWAARRAQVVITISHFSRRELIDRLGVAAEKIQVIPPGVDPPELIAATESERHHTASVLYVGSIFNRRHVPDLIRAMNELARNRPEVRLDLVGDNRSFPHEDIDHFISRTTRPAMVHWHRYVTDAELARLYGAARAFAFLSEYEGLGLTPLEALSVGVPSVLLDTAVARESCGDAALYVGRGDIKATALALETLLFDARTRAALMAAAPTILARYNWTTAAARTLAAIEGTA